MRVLVVEDEPIIRLGMINTIEDAGHAAGEAANADQALRVLEADASFSVVVTDVDMPGSMNGIELAHQVRRRWPAMQLVVLSGKVGVQPRDLPDGVPFMSKPCLEPVLLAAIESLAERAHES
jgi:CheY-like chemotaxis protein